MITGNMSKVWEVSQPLRQFWARWHTAVTIATSGKFVLLPPNRAGELEVLEADNGVFVKFDHVPAIDELFAILYGDCTCPPTGDHEPCPTCAAMLRAMDYEPLPQGVPLDVGLARG